MADAIRVTADVEQLRSLIRDLGERAAHVDLTPAMEAACAYQQAEVIRRVLRAGVDAAGSGLTPLSRPYGKRKARTVGVRPIGVLTGESVRSLSSGRGMVRRVSRTGFEWGSTVDQFGWFVNGTTKDGKPRMPKRDVLSFGGNDLVRIETIILEHVVAEITKA